MELIIKKQEKKFVLINKTLNRHIYDIKDEKHLIQTLLRELSLN